MDIVFVEALKVDTLIGIYDWERRSKQPVVLDLEMAFDNRVPAATDRIEDTLDYAAVILAISGYLGESSHLLLESMAESLCDLVFSGFPVAEIRLTARKPLETLGVKSVGIRIHRVRSERHG